ncbi:MAG: alpha/beta hydrolase, partial [Rhodospirillaceae bacterium]
AFISFDMFGHGDSSGRFEDGGISRWTEDALAVLDHLTEGPQILVGSSMGGWVMLKAALARPDRAAGLIGIAAGPDFTEDLMWARFSRAEREQLASKGVVNIQSDYDERPYPISRHLIEDGRANLVMRATINLSCPVRLMH